MNCPACQSENIKKNGHIHNGKQNYQCKECGRQFVENPDKENIDDQQRELIRKLLSERISLLGICRVMGVSLTWLLLFFRQVTDEIPDDMGIVKPEKSRLSIEIDEMWSFVGRKKNKQWVWLAIDRATGQIIGFHVGGRTRKDAKKLWASLPGVYRQCAVCYTDFWEAYEQVIPESRHRPAGKESGQTNRIERTNCTLRQRISRLVRETLSFSKIIDHHIRAIKYFIWNFNLALLV
ncbi:MAG: IS1 family transposase [Desulfobacteraceae bacterium]|nr:IS1 family transposase [Desulfobacteraceae bacterium]